MENSVNNCNYLCFLKRKGRRAYSDSNDVIEKLSKSLCSKYRDNLETSTKGSDFIFDSVQLMY